MRATILRFDKMMIVMIFVVIMYYSLAVSASCTKSVADYIKYDIKDKLTAQEFSAGSSFGKGGAGAGLHIYVNNNDIAETTEYSLQAKVVIHEYIHVLQQAFLAGDATTVSGPVTLRADATSTTRFHIINKCNASSAFGTAHLAALNNLPDNMKLLDIPVYVIEIPESGCDDTMIDTYTQEIFDEIYGSDCPGLDDNAGNILINENHAFAEGEAEYYALNDYIGLSMSTFNGPQYWTQKLIDDKSGCSVPGNEQFVVGDGSSCTVDALIDANIGSHCMDNPIGEISFSEMTNWCTSKGISDCDHQKLQRVWIAAGSSGWCDAFLSVYGHSWGSYICFMESALQVGSKNLCVEANVPCMSYVNPLSADSSGCSGSSSSSSSDDSIVLLVGAGGGVLAVLAIAGVYLAFCRAKKEHVAAGGASGNDHELPVTSKTMRLVLLCLMGPQEATSPPHTPKARMGFWEGVGFGFEQQRHTAS